MHRYNNKTYRIDDIDWEHNPTFEFETKSGNITLLAYYKKVRSACNPILHSVYFLS